MSLPLAFHPAVHAEIDDAYRWYDRLRAGLGEEFLRALDATFQRESTTPLLYGVVYGNARRAPCIGSPTESTTESTPIAWK